jgi:TPR repeat protein
MPKAVEWFRRAAASNDSDSMNQLGIAYRDGRGVSVVRTHHSSLSWKLYDTCVGDLRAGFKQ